MSHLFSQIPRADIQRSKFNRNSGLKTTMNSGLLVPIFCDEVLPGDTFNMHMTSFGRLATPIVPFLDNVYLDTMFFYCPSRLLWDNFERFHGAQDNPGDSTDYLIPTLNTNGKQFSAESIFDYFGLPINVKNLKNISALPFRAYNLIYNTWYRDENLQDSVPFNKGDGPDNLEDYVVLRRGKFKDYFTSSLPWPQKGPGVELPLGSLAPIMTDINHIGQGDPFIVNAPNLPAGKSNLYTGSFGAAWANSGSVSKATNLFADLSSASAATISSLRTAFQLQRLYERDARGGTRFKELLLSHFGVVSPDARLDRPEYLGGSSTRININAIAQTSATDSVSPQGNLAAMGTAGDNGHMFTKSFVEHGYIIGIANIRADLNYQQGVDRMWTRQTRFDFYYPVLAHLSEQAVKVGEIYAQGTSEDDEVFGYQERFAEYRYAISKITGKMRSAYAQPLDMWHLAQYFTSKPTLSADFIVDKPPISRVVAVQNEPEFLLDVFYTLDCVRPMPVYSVPGLVDHF